MEEERNKIQGIVAMYSLCMFVYTYELYILMSFRTYMQPELGLVNII